MKIDVWSDFVCPFCYIGKRRLEQALAQFSHRDQVTVEFKSFELDPNSPRDVGKSIHEVLAAKYRMSIEQAKKMNDNVAKQAAELGLTYQFDTMIPTNTFDAHRLTKFAKEHGKEAEITEALLYAYFTESKHIGDHDTLADIATQHGLNRDETLKILQDPNAYHNDVRLDQALAKQYQITGVPFFVINQKYAISGAQPLETFINALNQIWAEESKTPNFRNLNSDESGICTDDSCAIPDKNKS